MDSTMGMMGLIMGSAAMASTYGTNEVPIEQAMIAFGILGAFMVACAIVLYLTLR